MTALTDAEKQTRRTARLKRAANKMGYPTIDQLAAAILADKITGYYRQDNTLYPIEGLSEPANVLIAESEE